MANSKDVTAINNEKIDSTVLEMLSYIERLKSIFIRLDDTVFSTSNFYKNEDAEEFRKKYNNFRDNFPILIENLYTYIDELKAVKFNFQDMTTELSSSIHKDTINLESIYNRYQG